MSCSVFVSCVTCVRSCARVILVARACDGPVSRRRGGTHLGRGLSRSLVGCPEVVPWVVPWLSCGFPVVVPWVVLDDDDDDDDDGDDDDDDLG